MVGTRVLYFGAFIHHGCLFLGDVSSDSDMSDWIPGEGSWHQKGNRVVFNVLPGVDGMVECSVWRGPPHEILSYELLGNEFSCPSGWVEIYDAAGCVHMKFPAKSETFAFRVMVDNVDFSAKIQIILI